MNIQQPTSNIEGPGRTVCVRLRAAQPYRDRMGQPLCVGHTRQHMECVRFSAALDLQPLA
jgi:hypothetical protein